MLTAVAAGTITLTATYDGFTAQATWTISAGPLAIGAPTWTLSEDGLTVQQIVSAIPIPVSGQADLFSLESATEYGSSVLIRAITLDGSPVWSAQIPQFSGELALANPMPDSYGGLLLGTGSGTLDVDGSTGTQDWLYASPDGDASLAAINPDDGTVYVTEGLGTIGPYELPVAGNVAALDGATGQPKFVVDLVPSYVDLEYSPVNKQIGPTISATGEISVMPDGTVTFV
jgi:outer membrane protein assembly factor BamB